MRESEKETEKEREKRREGEKWWCSGRVRRGSEVAQGHDGEAGSRGEREREIGEREIKGERKIERWRECHAPLSKIWNTAT